jgi:hypothetical protein
MIAEYVQANNIRTDSDTAKYGHVCNACRTRFYRNRQFTSTGSTSTSVDIAKNEKSNINSINAANVRMDDISNLRISKALALTHPLSQPSMSSQIPPSEVLTLLPSATGESNESTTISAKLKPYRFRKQYSIETKFRIAKMSPEKRRLKYPKLSPQNIARWCKNKNKYSLTPNSKRKHLPSTRLDVFAEHPEVKKKILDLFLKLRSYGVVLQTQYCLSLLKSIIQMDAPHLLGNYKLQKSWFDNWMRINGGWTRRSGTTCMKTPENWSTLRERMIERMGYLKHHFNIHTRLCVNCDQTSILYLPTANSKTWTPKRMSTGLQLSVDQTNQILNDTSLSSPEQRTKIQKLNNSLDPLHKVIPIDGYGSKKAISTVVGYSAAGDLLPLQLIYRGKTDTCLPNGSNEFVCKAKEEHWKLVHKPNNHWSSVDTMMEYMETILLPYRNRVLEEENLSDKQGNVMLIIDCWSMHVHKLRKEIEKKYKFIKLVFVPANCTSKLQPCDVVVNGPLKREFKAECVKWMCEKALEAIRDGKSPTQLGQFANTSLKVMKPKLVEWLYKSWTLLKSKVDMLRNGWDKCGLTKALTMPKDEATAIAKEKPKVVFTMYGSAFGKAKDLDLWNPNEQETFVEATVVAEEEDLNDLSFSNEVDENLSVGCFEADSSDEDDTKDVIKDETNGDSNKRDNDQNLSVFRDVSNLLLEQLNESIKCQSLEVKNIDTLDKENMDSPATLVGSAVNDKKRDISSPSVENARPSKRRLFSELR